jgi:ParB family chromosome partitioning protein
VTAGAGAPVFDLVLMELIDEPTVAMRKTFDEEALDELTGSIRVYGVLEPIGLVPNGDRFTISYGHRRFIASIRAGRTHIPAMIHTAGADAEEAMKNHENAFREDVNPADEAEYFRHVLNTPACGGDVMKLAGIVGRKQSFVEDRLDLLRGYPEVFAALQAKQITLNVAKEFNKYKDPGFMLTHLDAAIKGGVRASQVRRWRTELEARGNFYPNTNGDGDPLPASQAAPAPKMFCVVCEGDQDPYNLEFVYVHRGGPCAQMLSNLIARLRGE